MKSTGPKTPRGKSYSRRNALKHGLFAKQVEDFQNLGENKAEYGDLPLVLISSCVTWGYQMHLPHMDPLLTLAGLGGKPPTTSWRVHLHSKGFLNAERTPISPELHDLWDSLEAEYGSGDMGTELLWESLVVEWWRFAYGVER